MIKETKKAKKAREIAERKAAAEAAKKAEHNRVFATPIAKAVAPLKIEAVANAEVRANEWIADRLNELKEAGWDLNKIAPVPSTNIGREEYRLKQARRQSLQMITKHESDWRDQSWRIMTLPHIVEKDPKGITRHIEHVRQGAAQQYEAFVYKMVKKVGDHISATLEARDVWGYSHLHVTKADGTVDVWRTQEIVNCSIYGKLFLQWPSRIVKK